MDRLIIIIFIVVNLFADKLEKISSQQLQFAGYYTQNEKSPHKDIEIEADIEKYKSNIYLKLTQKEIDYLQNKKVIKVCTNPDWAPIEFFENDIHQGISIDTAKIIASKLNMKLEFVKTKSWKESQQFLEQKKCDILPSAIETAKRLKYANFTKPYLNYKLAIITSDEKPLVENLESIIDKEMTRKKGSGLIAKLKKIYPNINIKRDKKCKRSI